MSEKNNLSLKFVFVSLICALLIGLVVGYGLHPAEKTVYQQVKVPDKLESLKLYTSVAQIYFNITINEKDTPINESHSIFRVPVVPRIQILDFQNFIAFLKANQLGTCYLDSMNVWLWVQADNNVYYWQPGGD